MWALLTVAGLCAAANWVSRARTIPWLEYATKPATMVALIGVALTLDPADDAQRAWFLLALGLSLVGDVLLMLPRVRFAEGLGAFLLAHMAYIGGFATAGVEQGRLAAGAAVMAAVAVAVGRPLARAVRTGPETRLAGPVAAYLTVISAMVAASAGHGDARAIAGAVLFAVSDGLIAWDRFVRPLPGAPVAIMVSYHVGQAALVLSLV